MKKYFKIFIYVSIAFLLYSLYKAEYLEMPDFVHPLKVIISIILIFTGFIFDAITWNQNLKVKGYKVSLKNCIISIGLSVFGKYIPGKFWLIAGRSAFINQKYGYSNKELLSVSVINQLISVWVGLLFGLCLVFSLKEISSYGFMAFGFWIFLTVIIFTKYPHNLFQAVLQKITKRNFKIPFINLQEVLKVMPWFIARWILFTLSFYFLINGLTHKEIEVYIGLAYPLAGTLGLIAFFTPGGLGIREGILTAIFILFAFTIEDSTSLSVTSRLWFLCGEFFIFFLGLILNVKEKFA